MAQSRKVVFIMTDTQRKDMLGCYGYPDMHTPNLDRLASQGMRFERAYTCQPVCGPARAGLFTGLWPHTNGSWANLLPLGDTVRTLGQRLQDRNIHTAYIGKWHLDGSDYFGTGRCPAGWDPGYWYDMRNFLEDHSPEDRLRSRFPVINRDPALKEDFTYAHRCSNRAVDFLSNHGGEDFFLVVSYDEPHHPYVCPEPYASMYQDYAFPKKRNVWDRLENKPEHQHAWAGQDRWQDKESLRIQHADYLGCNAFVDYEIGRVLQAVELFAPQALVIYTSDHGDHLASHSLNNKGAAMYDEITNIPFLVRWPGHTPTASLCPHPVSHIDLTPTILEAMGVDGPPSLEGRSMLGTFIDPNLRTNDAIFIEFGRYEVDHDGFGGFQPIRAVYDGRYKLVINLLSGDELYDLDSDPDEMINQVDEPALASQRDRLHDRLLAWMNDTRDPFRGYYWERRPWRTDARPADWDYTGMTRQRLSDGFEPVQLDYKTGLEIKEAVRKK
jgi:uncharacterized sulfatase